MTGYYMLKPVRGALLNELPETDLPRLTLVLMVLIAGANALYGKLARALSSRGLLITLTLFFAAALGFFALVFVPDGRSARFSLPLPFLSERPAHHVWNMAYFLFIGIYNVFTVTLFWSFVLEHGRPGEDERLFGPIAAGGTIGGIVGSLLTRGLVDAGLPALLLPAILCLLLTLIPMYFISTREKRAEPKFDPAPDSPKRDAWQLIRSSRYLRLILVTVLLMTSSATLMSYQLNAVIKNSILDRAARLAFWADLNLYVNIAALFAQFFLVGFVIRRAGLLTALLVGPLVDLVGCAGLGFAAGTGAAAAYFVGNASTRYSFNRVSRELLYAPTSRDFQYQAKALIDTLIYRVGDALTSLVLIFLGSAPLLFITGLNALVTVLRFYPAWVLARLHAGLTKTGAQTKSTISETV